jgi:hypothetical protein
LFEEISEPSFFHPATSPFVTRTNKQQGLEGTDLNHVIQVIN